MGLFGNQFANVVEWEEYRDDILFWKWSNQEIKKGSRLIIRPGQDAIFLYNGKVEGIFTDEGSFDIESEIIPFLSTLKGFKFGFNSGIRAEVLFINTKEVTVKWGTKNPINIPAQGLPAGMPVRAFGTFCCKISDHAALIDKVAGIKRQFTVDDVQERVISMLDQLPLYDHPLGIPFSYGKLNNTSLAGFVEQPVYTQSRNAQVFTDLLLCISFYIIVPGDLGQKFVFI